MVHCWPYFICGVIQARDIYAQLLDSVCHPDHYSPLTSGIYFPAIPTLVHVFHKSTELINLTVRSTFAASPSIRSIHTDFFAIFM